MGSVSFRGQRNHDTALPVKSNWPAIAGARTRPCTCAPTSVRARTSVPTSTRAPRAGHCGTFAKRCERLGHRVTNTIAVLLDTVVFLVNDEQSSLGLRERKELRLALIYLCSELRDLLQRERLVLYIKITPLSSCTAPRRRRGAPCRVTLIAAQVPPRSSLATHRQASSRTMM